MDKSTAQQVANILLEIQAVHLRPEQPFTWTSGIESPIYCDNRQIISYPKHRQFIAQSMARLIKQNFPTVATIAGTATAGIPHAAWIADQLELPMIYVRNKTKGHGLENKIEGHFSPRQPAVIIEDLISTAKSSLEACLTLQDAHIEALGIMAIFSYQTPKALARLEEANITSHCLCTLDDLLLVAQEREDITDAQRQDILNWRQSLD